MSKLSSLRGSVTVEVEGVEGAGVATFEVPIVVLEQARQGDVHAVAVWTPEGTLRVAISQAAAEALSLTLGSIPSLSVMTADGEVVDVAPAAGGVLSSFAVPVASDPPEEQFIPLPPASGRSEAIWAEAAVRIDAEGVGGSNP